MAQKEKESKEEIQKKEKDATERILNFQKQAE